MEKKEKIEIGIMGVYAIFIAVLVGLLAWNSVVLKEVQENTNDLEEEIGLLRTHIQAYNDLMYDLFDGFRELRDAEECEGIYMDENDKIELDFNKTTGVLSFVYYDNHFEQLKGSPDFTPENWTYLGNWTMDQHPDTFTQMQKNVILYLLANMAYYKETGTWLGE